MNARRDRAREWSQRQGRARDLDPTAERLEHDIRVVQAKAKVQGCEVDGLRRRFSYSVLHAEVDCGQHSMHRCLGPA